MSEEIKQLIDYLQIFVNDDRKEITKYGLEISQDNTKLLLNYIEQLQQENEELKKYCCKRNDCGGRLKENHKLTDSEVLTKFEKWLENELFNKTQIHFQYSLFCLI